MYYNNHFIACLKYTLFFNLNHALKVKQYRKWQRNCILKGGGGTKYSRRSEYWVHDCKAFWPGALQHHSYSSQGDIDKVNKWLTKKRVKYEDGKVSLAYFEQDAYVKFHLRIIFIHNKFSILITWDTLVVCC